MNCALIREARREYPSGPANHYKWLALQQAQSGALQAPVSAHVGSTPASMRVMVSRISTQSMSSKLMGQQ